MRNCKEVIQPKSDETLALATSVATQVLVPETPPEQLKLSENGANACQIQCQDQAADRVIPSWDLPSYPPPLDKNAVYFSSSMQCMWSPIDHDINSDMSPPKATSPTHSKFVSCNTNAETEEMMSASNYNLFGCGPYSPSPSMQPCYEKKYLGHTFKLAYEPPAPSMVKSYFERGDLMSITSVS